MEISIQILKIITAVEKLIPEYLANPVDNNISNGGTAICIITQDGQIFGRYFGENKIRCRETYRIAYIKASQVWITGMKTGEYEKMVFNNQIDENKYGISRPDLIGWEGGQPVTLKNGTTLSIGFSGFRGTSDLEIVQKAIKAENL
jgi:glc operon protein GlcG